MFILLRDSNAIHMLHACVCSFVNMYYGCSRSVGNNYLYLPTNVNNTKKKAKPMISFLFSLSRRVRMYTNWDDDARMAHTRDKKKINEFVDSPALVLYLFYFLHINKHSLKIPHGNKMRPISVLNSKKNKINIEKFIFDQQNKCVSWSNRLIRFGREQEERVRN